jgi:hypothetical protein
MQKGFVKKGLILGIIFLFFGVSISTCLGGISLKDSAPELTEYYNNNAEINRNNWWNKAWEYRKQITINHSMVTDDLQNFPVLISYTSPDFVEHAQYDGDDFVFIYDDNSKVYNHEIEYYDNSNGDLVAWVNITSLSSNDDTVLYLYYGNENCSSQEDTENVWDSDYIHVWHLGESLEDSAGTDDGNDHGTSKVTGKIGLARDFEQDEQDYIDFGDMAQPADGSLTTMTWEAWVKPETQDIQLMAKFYNINYNHEYSYQIAIASGGKFYNYCSSTQSAKTTSKTVDSYSEVGKWIYLVSTFNLGGVNDIDPFINGLEVSDIQTYSGGIFFKNINRADEIGRFRPSGGNSYTDAIIDEVRWSKIIRSDSWIETSYNTMNYLSSFISVGLEEIKNRPPNTPSDPIPSDEEIDVELDTYLTWFCEDPDGDNITYDIYFGITNPPPQIVSNQSETTFDPGILEFCTVYYWHIVAWDENGSSTKGPIWSFKTRCHGPPEAPRINGPNTGKKGKIYTYTFVSEDPNDDDVYYEIDWGDGQVDPWEGPYDSNEVITKSHSWDDEGTFKISARAKDINDAVGEWSEFEVIIPRNRGFYNLLKINFIENSPFLERIFYLIWN